MASYTTNYELLTSSIKILDNSTIALQRPNARRKRRHFLRTKRRSLHVRGARLSAQRPVGSLRNKANEA